MNVHACTDVGRERETNEDAVLATSLTEETELVAVADGMGGHASGEIASRVALSELESYLTGHLSPETSRSSLLENAALHIHEQLQTHAKTASESADMGTTLVAALIRDGTAVLVNVGDSRGYHVTDSTIEQITVDHSLVQELVADGVISAEEARTHPQRNVITQSLGASSKVDPDTYTIDITGTLVLCSDGLTEEIRDKTIQRIVCAAETLPGAASDLVNRANENGGSDNISVALAAPAKQLKVE